MTQLRISEAAELLGCSSDTVRRLVDSGRLPAGVDEAGKKVVAGRDLALVAQELANPADPGRAHSSSARNRMRGVVTSVITDKVMAQVEVQCGPFRIVSLLSREAVEDLRLEVGSVAVASIKSTNVIIETP